MAASCKATLFLFAAVAICSAQDLRKWTFEGGVGPTFPLNSARDRWNTGWNLDFGGGYRFTQNISGLLELQYNHFSLSDFALANFNQPAGYTRFWSFSLSPKYEFNPKGRYGGYVIGGYGLYARTLAFTDPSQAGYYCDPYYGYCDSTGAPVVASFTNYKGGINVGGGVSYALGESGFKLFTEVRYNRVFSQFNNDFLTLRFGLSY